MILKISLNNQPKVYATITHKPIQKLLEKFPEKVNVRKVARLVSLCKRMEGTVAMYNTMRLKDIVSFGVQSSKKLGIQVFLEREIE